MIETDLENDSEPELTTLDSDLPAETLDSDPADPPAATLDSDPPDVPTLPEEADEPDETNHRFENLVTWVMVALCCGFVFYSLHPQRILSNTTATGGDMGAHVWGPRFLREHLLPALRISGWTQDWYAGFPAYTFYMVVPSLMIVVLSTSPPIWLAPFLLAALAYGTYRTVPHMKSPWKRHLAIFGAVLLAVAIIPIPYNIAFKLVVVSGLVTLPLAASLLAKSLNAPFPVPALVAVSTLPFIYDKSFRILGGNGASTMAGEFAFSISLTFAILYLAVVFKGEQTRRWRALGAGLLALTVLCHLIPGIFAAVVTIVVLPVLRREPQDRDDPLALGSDDVEPAPWWFASRAGRVVSKALLAALVGLLVIDLTWLRNTAGHNPSGGGIGHWQFLFPAAASLAALVFFTGFEPRLMNRVTHRTGSIVTVIVTIGLGVALIIGSFNLGLPQLMRTSNWSIVLALVFLGFVYFVEIDWSTSSWLASVVPVAALLTGFWMLPFLSSSTFMNDMGWEKYTRYWDYLLSVPELPDGAMPYRPVVLVAAGVGLVLSVLMKVRMGWFLGLVVVVFAWMFRYFPQYRLWNARLLPFYFLMIYMLAGLGVALSVRFVSMGRRRGPGRGQVRSSRAWLGAMAAMIVVMVVLLGSFRVLPGGRTVPNPDKPTENLFRWAGLNFGLGVVTDWAEWNFSGVEAKPDYPEFRGLVDMMADIGREDGCGRALWEFDSELNRFGTTMALMMLPYYTDGCIASMEGLYFEASTTTPFHFLMQSALSSSPSRAQRDMPYPSLDIDLGVKQMQLMGVRYYMASSEQAITAALEHPLLQKLDDKTFTQAGVEHRWAVFKVRDVKLVEGLDYDPVVLKNANDHIDGWVYEEERLPPTEQQRETGSPGSKTAGPAVRWFMDPNMWDVFLATSGPGSWPRATFENVSDHRQSNPRVVVSDVNMDQDSISFDVNKTGVPVLVKVSYFPNWRVSGAEGPYRVSPNFMVVVPNSTHVELTFGRSRFETAGAGMTLVGVFGMVGLAVLDDRRRQRESTALG